MVRIQHREMLIVILFNVILLICTMMGGGLFWTQCIAPLCILSICFFLIEHRRISLKILCIIMLGIILLFLSLIHTLVDFQVGLYETEKLFLFFGALYIGVYIRNERTLFKTVYYMALIVAILGLFSYAGLFETSEFVFLDNGILRLQSNFKYANVTACYLGCGYFSFLQIYEKERKKWSLYGGAVILLAMFLTFSKACIPIFFLIGTLYMFFNKEIRSIFIFQSIITALSAIFALYLATESNRFFTLLVFVAAVIISGRVFLPNYSFLYKIWCSVLTLGMIGCVSLCFFKPFYLSTFLQRVGYMRDSLKLIGLHPFIGCGAGSWRYLQYLVQSTSYNVNYLHNGWLQYVVENGAIFAVFLIVLTVISLWRAFKKKSYGILSVLLLITLHSLIDIDFSFASMLMVFGLYIGSALSPSSSIEKVNSELQFSKHKILYIVVKVLVVLTFVSVSLYSLCEVVERKHFEKSYTEGFLIPAREHAEHLAKLCPYDSSVPFTLAVLAQQSGQSEDKICSFLSEAVRLSPYDSSLYASYMEYVATYENIEQLCLNYISLCPKQERVYLTAADFLERAQECSMISENERKRIWEEILKKMPEIKVCVNGIRILFPYVGESTAFVSIRSLLEAMQIQVTWDGDGKCIVGQIGTDQIILTVGEPYIYINGQAIKMDFPTRLVCGQVFAPIRSVVEALGGTVEWDAVTRTVYVDC